MLGVREDRSSPPSACHYGLHSSPSSFFPRWGRIIPAFSISRYMGAFSGLSSFSSPVSEPLQQGTSSLVMWTRDLPNSSHLGPHLLERGGLRSKQHKSLTAAAAAPPATCNITGEKGKCAGIFRSPRAPIPQRLRHVLHVTNKGKGAGRVLRVKRACEGHQARARPASRLAVSPGLSTGLTGLSLEPHRRQLLAIDFWGCGTGP